MLKFSLVIVLCISTAFSQDDTTLAPDTTPSTAATDTTTSASSPATTAGSTAASGATSTAGSADATVAPLGNCTDMYTLCPYWKQQAQCMLNKAWMETNCAASCSTTCAPMKIYLAACEDKRSDKCLLYAAVGSCLGNRPYMFDNCIKTCGWCNKAGVMEYPEQMKVIVH